MAASAPVVHIGENSPEQVAFKLMHEIANIEKKSMNHQPSAGWTIADRTWILDTCSECLKIMRDYYR